MGKGIDGLLRAWLDATWSRDLTLREWWHELAGSGYAFPAWPDGLGGRASSASEARAVAKVLAKARVIGAPAGVGQSLGGPTLLAHGTDAQKQLLVPPLARGAESWCQLFSEPGAGSDLASLQTTAVRDGDEWIVNGQKVWSSGAHLADRGMLLARTDRSVPKHEGISYFVIDMDQPGVEVRPLRQMNGASEFCEVFLTDARVPHDCLIGGPGAGWKVARTTLAFERTNVSASSGQGLGALAGRLGGMLDRRVGEILEEAARSPRQPIAGFIINNRAFGELARDFGRTADPVARQAIVAFRTRTELNRHNGLRAKAAAAQGRPPGAESSIGKRSSRFAPGRS